MAARSRAGGGVAGPLVGSRRAVHMHGEPRARRGGNRVTGAGAQAHHRAGTAVVGGRRGGIYVFWARSSLGALIRPATTLVAPTDVGKSPGHIGPVRSGALCTQGPTHGTCFLFLGAPRLGKSRMPTSAALTRALQTSRPRCRCPCPFACLFAWLCQRANE